MSCASSNTSSSCKLRKYDVFLSFRGEDTRKTFVSHLYDALHRKGIRVFKDDERLQTGKPISDELLKAIEESRSAIVVFSKDYASSKWCLEELAHIIKCQIDVIPIFYDVSPSDVRHQNHPFAESFFQHEKECNDDMEKVQRWRDTFKLVGKISGYHLQNYKDEAYCIKKLVDDILPRSLQVISPFPESLVGVESQIEKVISLLYMESNDVRFIGIWGMGGIGKTEVANFLYQRFRHQFEAYCFLGDVGASYQKNGLTWLEEITIYKLLGEKLTLTSEHEGMDIIRSMLRQKKVLFILDDVSNREQLEFLVGGPEWFARGSRIILTARDKHLLISHVGDNVYEVQLLPEDEALELFSRHAFREKSPNEDCMELSRQVVEYAGGLPLALKVLGSSFYKRDKEQWRDIIDRLKRVPHNDILGKLRISFDGLDKYMKGLFLDIVASLHMYDFKDHVELVIKSCSMHLIEVDYLIEKSLLSDDRVNGIVMHNMIREMGESVLREEYTNSRIWLPEEVHELFAGKLRTKKVENLCIPKGYDFEDDVDYSKVFKRMRSLYVLRVDDGTFSSGCTITYLPSSLRFINWRGYPSSSLPVNFEPSKLVVLCLHNNTRLVELWPTPKNSSNLKYLDLSESLGLTKTPNFDDMPNLETLILRECENLEEVHPSLGHCRMLTSLYLCGCRKLKKLPKFVLVESLKTLDLRRCISLEEFPNICGDMWHLAQLSVGSPWIRSLPLSLSGLTYLVLEHCDELESIPDTLQNLKYLYILGCSKLATLPNIFESERLEKLIVLECSRLVEIPQSLGVQKKLEALVIHDCENLKKLPSSIHMESLEELEIISCPKLDTFPEISGAMHGLSSLNLAYTGIRELPLSIGHLSGLDSLRLDGCEDLGSLPNSLFNLKNLRGLYLHGCKKLEKLPENIGDLQQLEALDACVTAIDQQVLLSIMNLGKLKTLILSNEQLQHSSSFVWNQLSALSSLTHLELGNCNILGGLPEDLGCLHSLEYLSVSGSNISSLPNSISKLLSLRRLNVQFCLNFNEMSEELPPNLVEVYADYHLALKSIRDLVMQCVMLEKISLSWCGHEKTKHGTVSTNHFIQQFLSTCIQNDFHERRYFSISFPEDRISEIFDYQFTNQKDISINLIPSWYTDKFMGFSICCFIDGCQFGVHATLISKSDPERKHSLKCSASPCWYVGPVTSFIYIPFKTWWHTSDNKEGKNPNDYCLLEVSVISANKVCWGIRLEYEIPLTLHAKGITKKRKSRVDLSNSIFETKTV